MPEKKTTRPARKPRQTAAKPSAKQLEQIKSDLQESILSKLFDEFVNPLRKEVAELKRQVLEQRMLLVTNKAEERARQVEGVPRSDPLSRAIEPTPVMHAIARHKLWFRASMRDDDDFEAVYQIWFVSLRNELERFDDMYGQLVDPEDGIFIMQF